MSETIHATAVAIGGRAVLIQGPSGSGKSDLALRLIDRGATLVADDRILLEREDDTIYACTPGTIAGSIEVRGVGILSMEHVARAPVALLVRIGTPERLPQAATDTLAGVVLPVTIVSAREASAPLKVELALQRAVAA